MDNVIIKNNGSLQTLLKTAGGVVILPLKKWKVIEENLENLEMYRCVNFAKEIAIRRKETKAIPLGKMLKKYKIQ